MEEGFASLVEFVIELFPAIVMLLVLGLTTKGGTDILKGIERSFLLWFSTITKGKYDPVANQFRLRGFGSLLVAGLVAYVQISGMDIDVVSMFAELEMFDAEQLVLINTIVVMLVGGRFHKKFKK